MNSMQRHLHHLSVNIGPRGSTSANERLAANYIERKLAGFGYTVKTESFTTIPSFSLIQLIFIFGLLASFGTFLIQPGLSSMLAIGLLILYLLDVDTRFSLARFLPRKSSQNVRALLPNSQNNHSQRQQTKVVLMAHYDSSRAGLNFHPKLVSGFRSSFFLLIISMGIIALGTLSGTLLQLLGRSHAWVFYAMTPFALYLLVVALLLIHRELWGQITPGANDNASGVSVLLGVAKELRKNPLKNLDVEFVATGAEEAGTFGCLDYLKRHGVKDTYFINLDNLGAGKLFITTSEGILKKYKADSRLVALAQECIYSVPTLPVQSGGYHLLTTDATPIMVRGGKAISIMAKDEQGLLPNWHWITDTAENVESSNLSHAKTLVVRLIKRLNGV